MVKVTHKGQNHTFLLNMPYLVRILPYKNGFSKCPDVIVLNYQAVQDL